VGRCLEPEGNGVNPGGGYGGGPGPPCGEQDKQLITSRERDNSPMGQQGRPMGRGVRCDKEDPSCTEYVNTVDS
jgi:hypothetical protein